MKKIVFFVLLFSSLFARADGQLVIKTPQSSLGVDACFLAAFPFLSFGTDSPFSSSCVSITSDTPLVKGVYQSTFTLPSGRYIPFLRVQRGDGLLSYTFLGQVPFLSDAGSVLVTDGKVSSSSIVSSIYGLINSVVESNGVVTVSGAGFGSSFYKLYCEGFPVSSSSIVSWSDSQVVFNKKKLTSLYPLVIATKLNGVLSFSPSSY